MAERCHQCWFVKNVLVLATTTRRGRRVFPLCQSCAATFDQCAQQVRPRTVTAKPTARLRALHQELIKLRMNMQIADAEAPTLENALRKLEAASATEQRRAA